MCIYGCPSQDGKDTCNLGGGETNVMGCVCHHGNYQTWHVARWHHAQGQSQRE